MPLISPTSPFQRTFAVEAHDIDELGHVNNAVYLRWVQEIVTLHWQEVAPNQDKEQLLWVVSRHEIDYKSPAMLGDEVLVRTWVGEVQGLTFERHTTIQRAGDEQFLAQARTLWVPINRQTRRPQRLRPEVRALFSIEKADAISAK
jgi:acyl-CoA thioester hydrolase